MKKVTISSSLRYKEMVRQAILELKLVGVVGLFPNLDIGIAKEDVDLEFMKKIETEHFEVINASEALYVICPDGKVGILVSVEIGFARAKGKAVIFSETPEDLGLQAMATDYVPLDDLKRIKDLKF